MPKPKQTSVDDFRNRRASERATRAAKISHTSGRRRCIDPATTDRDYSVDELEFMYAMQEYKRSSGRMFPTWSEVLEVFKGLGYQRVQPEAKIQA